MIKIGVIGTGNMGKNHVRILSEETSIFRLEAIYDMDTDTAISVSKKYGGIKVTRSAGELLGLVDAAVIAVPSSRHMEVALKAAEMGVHTLVEKPLALSSVDADRICNAFEKSGAVLMVGHVERYNPVVAELENIIKGENAVAFDIHRCSPFSPRISDADVISDLMIHDIDILCSGLNPVKIKRIGAQGSSVFSKNSIDYAQALIEFENGVLASITSSRITEDKIRTIDVHAKEAFIRADLLSRELQITRRTNYACETCKTRLYEQDSVIEKVVVPSAEPLRAELLSFADCITNGTKPLTGGKTSSYAIDIASRIRASVAGSLKAA